MKVLAVVKGKLVGGTPAAYLIESLSVSDKMVKHWIPRSLVEYKRTTKCNGGPDDVVIEIPAWLAIEKRMDYEEKK